MTTAALRRALPLLLSASFALCQSGTPDPIQPLKNHDPRYKEAVAAMAARVRTPGSVAISPDGTTLAWTIGARGDGSALHLTNIANPDPAKDAIIAPNGATACSNGSPLWSPDGSWLAYLSTCTSKEDGPGQQEFFLWNKATGESKQLTHIKGAITSPAWSPNGKSIALLFVENATRSAGALAAMKPWSGVIGEDGVEIQRVAHVAVADGAFSFITPANLHAYEFSWAPNASEIIYVAANPPGENNWWVAQIYTQHLGDKPKSVLNPGTISGPLHHLQVAVPRISPDGKQIAFIGGLMSDQGSTGGDIYLMPVTGGEPKNITPGRLATPVWITWAYENTLGVNEDVRGQNHIFLYNTKTQTASPLVTLTTEDSMSAGGIKGNLSVSDGGILAFVRSGSEHPPEIWAGALPNVKQITHLNDGAKSATGKTESIEWENEGFHVQGWLTYPVNYDAHKKYPLIVSVHGGPSSSVGSRWGGSIYSALGYFVFSPNPRGSYGQGEKFTQANVKDFGYGDLRDILAGMDTIEKKVPAIDKAREGLTGWSYGGFMTMFAVTQTHRFRAAVAGAGIANWQSYYGENSIDQWMVPFFGATVYNDPAVYAKSSAINYIRNVTTPTLVVVGDRDGECPAPQSFEFWHAVRALGVKTQLVVYPNEGHGFRNPVNRADLQERSFNWFEENMPAR